MTTPRNIHLNKNGNNIRITAHNTIDSTQLEARRLAESHTNPRTRLEPTLITATQQTAGIGRSAKPWQSPTGGLWATLLHPLPKPPTPIQQTLGLAIGVATTYLVRRTLAAADAPQQSINNTRLKWPNDVYINSNKVLGVLTEIITTQHQHRYALIGVGLNLNITKDQLNTIARNINSKQTPPHYPPTPTSILAETGVESDIHAVKHDLANTLSSILTTAADPTAWSDASVIEQANQLLWGIGQHQHITLNTTNSATGILLGLNNTGIPILQPHTITNT